jgi:hypothetical protein
MSLRKNELLEKAMTIRDSAHFFGRIETLDYLYSEITECRCVSVIGSRRLGKSSLLCCLSLAEKQQEFAHTYNLEKHLFVFVDLEAFLSRTVEEFFAKICSQLIAQGKDRLSLSIEEVVNGEERFWKLLEQIQDQDFHPVLLLDNFQMITRNTEFDLKFFAFMRAQANMGLVSYITASTITLDKCYPAYAEGSPFFNIFITHQLGPLTEAEACQLITQPASKAGVSFSEEEVKQILTWAGRHPFFLQRATHIYSLAKVQSQQRTAKQLYSEIYNDLLPHFKDIWENSLEANEREILKEEAQWKNVSRRRLPELSASSLFRQFIRSTCDIHLVDITEEMLADALENYRDTRTLAESELTHLYLFSAHTQHITKQLSPNDKARYVRQILQEALDRLRPANQTHSDTNPDWQAFNILNYRYFKGRMKHEILADRVGISVRQLHRERDIAIQLLRDELIEMEMQAKEALDEI